ncbi:HD domain-containing protein [Jeotgalibacillus sp. S-D1]|uniref:HD domain-containing protein n=1 Tax=Jeotgalibacillus sp. S-D1 TaxID=2552189 RepID=UPI001059F10D|nr:HD domain-containing protein [Jeotgalibacillus sp. S-D1]TDL34794.1 HD domain-containing protein [Jeotgalibacillus sp. S-D1]
MNTFTLNHIHLAEAYARPFFERDHSGHDWDHIQRVRRTALFLCQEEKCENLYGVDLIALLHDAGDPKLHNTISQADDALKKIVSRLDLSADAGHFLIDSIKAVSFNGGHEKKLTGIEAAIVRDADRLDAIGAIGIARAFAYGGSRGSKLYDEEINIRHSMTEHEYRTNQSTSIHHFYEKLFKLKDRMITESGKKLAEDRHRYMEGFVKQFLKEWKGNI